jgi:hypothetical protein
MKINFLSSSRGQIAACRLLLAGVLLVAGSVHAQNLLKNGDFESPLDPWDPTGLTGGKTNWTLVYVSGGPGDFVMKDRSTEASHNGYTEHGVHLRPASEWWCHAYFTQTVTNLMPGSNYVCTGWINKRYLNVKDHTYIELLGGSDGTVSVVSLDVSVDKWHQYWVTNTASATGKIEVRLHESKQQMPLSLPGVAKYKQCDSRFDDFSLTLATP